MDFQQFMGNLAGFKVEQVPVQSEQVESEGQERTKMEADRMIDMLQHMKDEYIAKNLQMEKIIEKIGTLEHVDGSAKLELSETAEMLERSSVVDINPTNVFLQQIKMKLDESRLSEMERKYQNRLQKMSSRIHNLEQRSKEFIRDIQCAKDEYKVFQQNAEGKVIDRKLMEHQMEKCKKELLKLQHEKERLQLVDSNELRVVQQRVEAIAEMKEECDKLKLEMEEYKGLPPDLQLAEEMLAQTISMRSQQERCLRSQINSQRDRAASMMSIVSEKVGSSFK